MARLWQTFKETSPLFKAIFVLVAVALTFSIFQEGQSCASKRGDVRAQEQINTYKAERDAAIERGNQWEEKAKSEEAEKTKYQLALEIGGKDARKAMEKVNEAEAKFNQDVERINTNLSDCERYNQLRAGLKLAPVSCQ